MGKNINGGNKNKKFARKHSSISNNKIRFANDDDYEKYAVVIRISGGGNCIVRIFGNTNELRCRIRGKFSGRNKFSNLITKGGVLLIALRPDMSSNDECDLLYVYDSNEIEQLLKFPNFNIAKLLTHVNDNINEFNNHNNDDGFIFSNEDINYTLNDNDRTIHITDDIIDIDDI